MFRHSLLNCRSAVKTSHPIKIYYPRRSFTLSSCVWNSNNDENKSDNGESADTSETHAKSSPSSSDEKGDSDKPNLETEVKELTQKFKELQSQYLLALADQENLRQRTVREVNNAKEFSIQKFAKDILDSVDILNMALKSVPNDLRDKENCLKKEKEEIAEQLSNLYTGVSMTEAELLKTLKRYDIIMDNPIDQEFDPKKHEAVFQAPVPDKKPGTIFVVQKVGYLMKNRVLRAAQVGVVAEVQNN